VELFVNISIDGPHDTHHKDIQHNVSQYNKVMSFTPVMLSVAFVELSYYVSLRWVSYAQNGLTSVKKIKSGLLRANK